MNSQGGGFAARDVRFTTKFRRPNRLHFSCSKFDGGGKIGWADVTWDGKATIWRSHEFGSTRDRTLANALGILTVEYGSAADLIPTMLLPDEFNGMLPSTRFKEIVRLADENVGEVRCVVLRLRNQEPVASATRLWIDPKTHFILRQSEGLRGTTVSYRVGTD
ncbi:MAG TPA: hypothetical protein VEX38_00340 [Fimbriimonadaceae bacterium]|nr:hypothetical protein [Fimbriimonadaceae bacterium]